MSKIFILIILILIICIICGLLYKYGYNTQYNTLDKFIDSCSNTNMDLLEIITPDFSTNSYNINQYIENVNLGTFTSFNKYDYTGFINKTNLEIETTKFLYHKLKFLNILASLNDYCRQNNSSNFIASFGIKININTPSSTNLFELSFADFSSPSEISNSKLLYISYVDGVVKIKSELFNVYEQNIQMNGVLKHIYINSQVYRKNQTLQLKCNIKISHNTDQYICFSLDNINDDSVAITSINLFRNYYLSLLKFMIAYYTTQYSIEIDTKYIPIIPSSNMATFQSSFNTLYNANFNIIKNNYITLFNNDIFNPNLHSTRLKPLFYNSYQTTKNNYEQNIIKENNATTLNNSINTILSSFNQMNLNTKIDSFSDIKKKSNIEDRFTDNINNLKKFKKTIENFNDVSLVQQMYPPPLLSTKSASQTNLFNKIITNNQFDPSSKIAEIKNLEKEFGRQSNDVYNILTAISRLPTNEQITTDKAKI